MKKYGIWMEVAGLLGQFGDHTTGSETRSHPIPPPTAAKGIIESVCWLPTVRTEVVAVAVCSKPRWMRYTYNSHVPNRKPKQIADGDAVQLREEVLFEPRFQILALLYPGSRVPGPGKLHINQPHAMQEMFMKRLMRSQSYHPVSLGRKEFLATYFGKPITPVRPFNRKINSMAVGCFGEGGEIKQQFSAISVENGVARFTDESVELRDGILVFSDPAVQGNIDFLTEKWSRKGDKRTNAA